MDKFTNILQKIKGIIEKIDTQIETKNMNIDVCNEKIREAEAELEEINATLKDLEEKRLILGEVRGNKPIVAIFKKVLEKLLIKEKAMIKEKEWPVLFISNLFGFLLSVSVPCIVLANPVVGLAILASLGVWGAFVIKDDYFMLNRLTKDYTPETLEAEINQKKQAQGEKEKRIARLRNKKFLIKGFIDSLDEEKEFYKNQFAKIQRERTRVYNEQATPLLNAAYNSFDTSEVESRIRARERNSKWTSIES